MFSCVSWKFHAQFGVLFYIMYVALCLIYSNQSNIMWVTMILKDKSCIVLHQFLQSTIFGILKKLNVLNKVQCCQRDAGNQKC